MKAIMSGSCESGNKTRKSCDQLYMVYCGIDIWTSAYETHSQLIQQERLSFLQCLRECAVIVNCVESQHAKKKCTILNYNRDQNMCFIPLRDISNKNLVQILMFKAVHNTHL